ncbi:MAG TPA: hypothetical protein VE396_11765 [Xanthobacteraceae bacterium]|nr:hypothetical protein [Xanthobacteraceae bacterium]
MVHVRFGSKAEVKAPDRLYEILPLRDDRRGRKSRSTDLGSKDALDRLDLKLKRIVAATEEERDLRVEQLESENAALKAQLAEQHTPPSELPEQTKPQQQTSPQPPLPKPNDPIPKNYLRQDNPWSGAGDGHWSRNIGFLGSGE